MAAPIGGLVWASAAFALRLSVQFILAKVRGHRFTALDRPVRSSPDPTFYTGGTTSEGDAIPTSGGYYGDQKIKFF